FYDLIYMPEEFADPTPSPYLSLVIGTAATPQQYPTLEQFAVAALFEYVESAGMLGEFESIAHAATPLRITTRDFTDQLETILGLLNQPPREHLVGLPFKEAVQLYKSYHSARQLRKHLSRMSRSSA